MLPDPRFLKQPKAFWADVRTISQAVGYTVRVKNVIRVPTVDEIAAAYHGLGLESQHLVFSGGVPTATGRTIIEYFEFRAERLMSHVLPRLMDEPEAAQCYRKVRHDLGYTKPPVMNKQKGRKKKPAYLTCLVNMLLEAHSEGVEYDTDPRSLTTITRDGRPVRTMARRVDGAFPSVVNPVAIWEVKEYYFTTTFGSRVADGVYETLLDGMELEELREHEGVVVRHYLMLDSRNTWWKDGKSYLCRIIDMLYMGYVDEVLFGREVIERLPTLVRSWVAEVRSRNDQQ